MSRQLTLDFDPHQPRKVPLAQKSEIGLDMREISHEGVRLRYQLRRSRRRSIGLVIGESGLRVAAPSWVGMQQIEAAIRDKFSWIVRKLDEIGTRRQKLASDDQNWQFGGLIPYMGCSIELCGGQHPNEQRRGEVWFDGDPDRPVSGQKLWLPLPFDSQQPRVREMAQGWLQNQARHWFEIRLKAFEAQCGLRPTSWRLSSASSRWGSCNSRGRIGLNWRLIHFEPAVIDYVVAHELAHLREMNHSDAFWSTLRAIYPDYLQGHRLLKAHVPGELPML